MCTTGELWFNKQPIFYFIGDLDIFPLISPSDIVFIYDVNHIITLLIKTNNVSLNIQYH